MFKSFEIMDFIFTIFFMVEITLRIIDIEPENARTKFGIYISDGWNKLDFFSVIVALPSLGIIFNSSLEIFAGFTVLRLLRVFKLFRVISFIPNARAIINNIVQAFKGVTFIIIAFFIYTTIISIVTVSIFKKVAPEYFANAYDGFFTTFRLFGGDTMTDIMDLIQKRETPMFLALSKLYFVAIVFSGMMMGISLIQCILIEQMSFSSEEADEKHRANIENMENNIAELRKTQLEILATLKEREA